MLLLLLLLLPLLLLPLLLCFLFGMLLLMLPVVAIEYCNTATACVLLLCDFLQEVCFGSQTCANQP